MSFQFSEVERREQQSGGMGQAPRPPNGGNDGSLLGGGNDAASTGSVDLLGGFDDNAPMGGALVPAQNPSMAYPGAPPPPGPAPQQGYGEYQQQQQQPEDQRKLS